MNDVTRILQEWTDGDGRALERLAPLIYPELRSLARAYLRRGPGADSLQTTEVVSELFVRLLAHRPAQLHNRRHFYALAARIIRMALVDHYRYATAERRWGQHERVPLHDDIAWIDANGAEMLWFDDALSELETFDPELCELVGLRFVLGCTATETAELMRLSKATVDRRAQLARAWLQRRLTEHPPTA
jgi:RNA polymerase sigma factor (TIGR02999 family)